VIVAVKVTDWPNTEGLIDEFTAEVVPSGLTVKLFEVAEVRLGYSGTGGLCASDSSPPGNPQRGVFAAKNATTWRGGLSSGTAQPMPPPPISLDRVRRILAGTPQAVALLDSVHEFYGDCLQFLEDTEADGPVGNASFRFRPDNQAGLAFQSAEVTIKMGRERALVSIIHELLHLDLRIRGFPTGCRSEDSVHSESWVDQNKLHDQAFNVLDHFLFKARFVEIGFPPAEIVPDPRRNRESYVKSWTDTFSVLGYGSPDAVRCACHTCFIGFITDLVRDTSGEVVACRAAIEPYLPDISSRMRWLPDWFNRGHFAIPSLFPPAFQEALTNMSIARQQLCILAKTDRAIEARSV